MNIDRSQANVKLIKSIIPTFDFQVDYDARHEAFWFIGGVKPPASIRNFRKKYKWLRGKIEEPVDRPVQYIGMCVLLDVSIWSLICVL